jgi:FkbM family methyltransferase
MLTATARLRNLWRASGCSSALRSTLRWLPRDIALPILWGPLRGKRWIVHSSFESCWLGVYEQEKQSEFSALIRRGDVVYDIGANVGFYTLLASTLVGLTGRVIAFEPLPRNLDFLQRHLALNRVRNVEVFAGAVSNRSGSARFDNSGIPEMGRLADSGELIVEAFQIDELLSNRRILPPDLLKVDVEGAEFDVLSGASECLQTHHPTVLLATHGDAVHRDCCSFLEGMGYELRALDGRPLDESREVVAKPFDSADCKLAARRIDSVTPKGVGDRAT